MGKFSLREIVLVTTVFGLAMAVNVWNHRDLRVQLERAQRYAGDAERYANRLHREMTYAKQESEVTNSQILAWAKSGELKPAPRSQWTCCLNARSTPDWSVLKIAPPKQAWRVRPHD
jgi:hypothetical protein